MSRIKTKKDRDKPGQILKKSAFNNFLCFNFYNFFVAAIAAAIALLVVAAVAVAIAIAVAELVEVFVILLLFEIHENCKSSSGNSKNCSFFIERSPFYSAVCTYSIAELRTNCNRGGLAHGVSQIEIFCRLHNLRCV